MQPLVNPALIPLINDGFLNMEKLSELIYVREFVDRNSTKMYISTDDADELKRKYGVRPNIITWGDYFQAELGTTLAQLDIDEFRRAIDTVRYDIISSHQIFEGKDSNFFEWVDTSYMEIQISEKIEFSEEEEDIIHLKILKDYYVDMGIVPNFTEAEMQWYQGFREAAAM